MDSCDDVVALRRAPALDGMRIVIPPFDVDAVTSLLRGIWSLTSIAPFEVESRIGSFAEASTSVPRIAPFEVVAFNVPRTLSIVTLPFEVRIVTPPSADWTSTGPFDV